ncbi:lipopolysaccharide biosynthesis protein [Ancrocorticia sp.]|uniref:lipopolysaccharide biosynthesis protein n=2 Tax=Ancrocorticia sp. TaxID=2593684 RepID=UPI003F9330D1
MRTEARSNRTNRTKRTDGRRAGSRRTGSVLITISMFSGALVQWYLVWIFARYLGGPKAAGTYSSLVSLLTPIFIVASLGLRTVYLTLRSVWPLRTYVFLRVIGLIVGCAAFLIVALLENKYAIGLVLVLMASRVFDLMSDIYAAAIQRQDRLAWLGTAGIASGIITALAVTVSAVTAGTMAAAIGSVAVVSLAFYAVYWRTAGDVDRDVPPAHQSEERVSGSRRVKSCPGGKSYSGRKSFPGIRSVLRAGVPVTISQGIAAIAAYLPVLILSRWVSEEAIGVFAAAAYLITAANLVGAAAQTVLISPLRIQYASQGAQPTFRRALRVNGVLLAIGVICIPIIVFLGNPVLQFVYGQEFSLPQSALVLLALAVVPIAPSYLFSAVLSVFNYFRIEALVWACAVIVASCVGVVALSTGVDPLSAGMIIAGTMSWTRFAGVSLCAWWIATRRQAPQPQGVRSKAGRLKVMRSRVARSRAARSEAARLKDKG